MNFRWAQNLTIAAAFAAIAILATRFENVTEINTATGATRSRSGFVVFPNSPWKETPTWVSERAQELGIDTSHAWQFLGRRYRFMGLVTRACGDTPVSHHLNYVPEEEEMTDEERDAFVRQFIGATEEQREEILRKLQSAGSPL